MTSNPGLVAAFTSASASSRVSESSSGPVESPPHATRPIAEPRTNPAKTSRMKCLLWSYALMTL